MKRNTKTSEERERRIMLSNTSNLIKELDELTKKTFISDQTQQKTIELIDSYYKQYIKTNL